MKDLLQTWQFHHGFQPFVETSLVGLGVGMIHFEPLDGVSQGQVVEKHVFCFPEEQTSASSGCFSMPGYTLIEISSSYTFKPSLPYSHCIAETYMDKDNDAERI